MNIKKTVAMGAAVVAIMGTVAFAPASADSREDALEPAANVVAMAAIAETPQDQVWDMTYGADRPVAHEEQVAEALSGDDIVDYTFG
jgi:hypothetical protein